MGKMKSLMMDLEDRFYDNVPESLVNESENFQEFSTRAFEFVDGLMSKRDSDGIAVSVWNEFCSAY